MPSLLIAGFGYSAEAVVGGLSPDWRIAATCRRPEGALRLAARGIRAVPFDGPMEPALADVTHLLVSIPPGEGGDPFLNHHGAALRAAPKLGWIGYLSTIGVYGDRGGAWVDEGTPPAPMQPRSVARLAAEEAWRALAAARGASVQLLRLGGIYGPGRNVLADLAAGTARCVVKPGQVFNRIHVADIGALVRAGIAKPRAGPVLHGVDDAPAPPRDVVAFAARLLNVAPPPELSVEAAGLSPMGLSFYAENKRVSNAHTKAVLDWAPLYPTYREGLEALAASGEGVSASNSPR